jgi:hypothetical protein
VRPVLERLRDFAAEGQVEAILVYAPDRPKYAYPIPLIEQFARNGVETVYIKAPKSATLEDQSLLQYDRRVGTGAESRALTSWQAGAKGKSAHELRRYGYRDIRTTRRRPTIRSLNTKQRWCTWPMSANSRSSEHRRHQQVLSMHRACQRAKGAPDRNAPLCEPCSAMRPIR